MRFKRTFALRTLLAVLTLSAIGVWLTTLPVKRARHLCELIASGKRIGPHEYLDDGVLDQVNGAFDSPSAHLPGFTHSYATEILPRSVQDFLLCRQPIYIEYTAHPIPPAYTGEIKRYRVSYVIGLAGAYEVGRSEKVIWVYIE